MMTENIRILVLLAALALPMIVKSSDDGLNRVREALSALINEKHWDDSYYHTIINYDIDYRDVKTENYRNLVSAVSSNNKDVLANLDSCATNRLERILVLSVRDKVDIDFYLEFVDCLASMAENGRSSLKELHWTIFPIGTVYEKHLVRSYRDQRTRRLIEKLQRIGALDKAYCDDILSGKAYREYVNEVSAGLWNDPLVPVWDYPIIRVAIIAASVLLAILIIVIGWLLKRYLSNK